MKKHNLANNLHHVDDGEEALDFIFGREKYAGRIKFAAAATVTLLPPAVLPVTFNVPALTTVAPVSR